MFPEGENAMRDAFGEIVPGFQRALSDVDLEIEIDADPPGAYTPFYMSETVDAAGVIRMTWAKDNQLLRSEISVNDKIEIESTGMRSLRDVRAAAGEMLGKFFVDRLREELAQRDGD